jgi:hypothetical protein
MRAERVRAGRTPRLRDAQPRLEGLAYLGLAGLPSPALILTPEITRPPPVRIRGSRRLNAVGHRASAAAGAEQQLQGDRQ